jgi:hypothetical protein
MTIHWKALEEHFLMVPFIFQWKMHFLNFSQKTSVLEVLMLTLKILIYCHIICAVCPNVAKNPFLQLNSAKRQKLKA